MKLKQFYKECSKCGYNVKFNDTEEVLNCPGCGNKIQLSDSVKEFLKKEEERLKSDDEYQDDREN